MLSILASSIALEEVALVLLIVFLLLGIIYFLRRA